MQGTIPSPPPTTAATISSPVSGRSYNTTPIEITGLCTADLTVKIFSNNIFVGAANCERGSYRLQVDLFSGDNQIVARVFDALDQSGPDSNIVNVNFQDATFAAFNQRVSLTSTIAKNGAAVGSELSWPITLSGGTGPYAISVDWGDGTASDLKSMSFATTFDLTHTYKTAGIYRVVVKATDANGTSAFLQLIGVGSGPATQKGTGEVAGTNTTVKSKWIIWPVFLIIPFAGVAFWIGRRFEVVSIHRRLEKQASLYSNELQR